MLIANLRADAHAPAIRLTKAFSKKIENHVHMALYIIWYNFVLQHKTLRVSSLATAAGSKTGSGEEARHLQAASAEFAG